MIEPEVMFVLSGSTSNSVSTYQHKDPELRSCHFINFHSIFFPVLSCLSLVWYGQSIFYFLIIFSCLSMTLFQTQVHFLQTAFF